MGGGALRCAIDCRATITVTPPIELTLTDLYALDRRIERRQLEGDDLAVFSALVSKLIAQAERRQQRALDKIAAEAANQQETGDKKSPNADADNAETGDTSSVREDPSGDGDAARDDAKPSDVETGANDGDAKPTTGSGVDSNASGADKPKGHGRNGAGAYIHASHVSHTLASGVLGMPCKRCGRGNITPYREKISVVVKGQPLFHAEAHHCEQGRCRKCGHIIRAEVPDAVQQGVGSDYVRYDWSACALLILIHYFASMPFKRLEALHQSWGMPLADANQWEVVNECDDYLLPLYKALERHGIQQATHFRIDDTGSEVIEVRRRIRAEIAVLEALRKSTKDVRTGINATAAYFETPSGRVILFYTGRHHAGEIVDLLLRYRRFPGPKVVKVTDGASKNFDHGHQGKVFEATCNAHAFLKFRAVKDKYPEEYATAGRIYKQVFDNDDEAKARGLSPMERMLYHREHSKPLMNELKAMCAEKIESKLVEPNSPLWEPLTFIINQWERLTLFCSVPDVPLDTNIVEQALIIPVRYLASSFNYRTQDGADVGDHHMSLVATAYENGVEPVAYLTECLRNHEDLAKRPEYYLPWVYRERMKDNNALPDATPEHPPPAVAATP